MLDVLLSLILDVQDKNLHLRVLVKPAGLSSPGLVTAAAALLVTPPELPHPSPPGGKCDRDAQPIRGTYNKQDTTHPRTHIRPNTPPVVATYRGHPVAAFREAG